MAPKKAKAVKRDQKHGGKNGKKEGLSGSSFFTWFMVIALLGVWTSVAVVWFDLVDYEEFLAKAKDFRYNLSEALQGKLGDYDADGDGDFDVDDAKVLLGLKERFVSEKTSEDLDETDSLPSDISDADLQEAIRAVKDLKDSLLHGKDGFDLEDAVDDHETHDESEFSLDDAVEPSVHGSLTSEPEVEEEPVIEEKVHAEEQTIEELFEEVFEHDHAAGHEDHVEETPFRHEDEHAAAQHVHEQEVKEEETEFLTAPHTETEEPADVEEEDEAEPLAVEEPAADEEPEAELAAEEPDENQELEVPEHQEFEYHEESVLHGEEDDDDTEAYEEIHDYNPQLELEEEELAELDEPDGEYVHEHTEEAAPESYERDEEAAEAPEDVVTDDSEEINDLPVAEEPYESAEDHSKEPESPHEHIAVEQNEIPEHLVVDDRPSERAEEQDKHTPEGHQGGHADT